MRAKALSELNDAELAQRLEEAKEEQFNLRFQLATGQLENSARINQVRRYIARIRTLIREREIAAAEAAEEQA
ncbi:MAG: 50S ribosomal protein L29 [Actinomycetes bacterium]